MKIALVSPYDWSVAGGVNNHIASLAREFARAGHTVRIVAPSSRRSLDVPEHVTIIGHSSIGLPASGSVANVSLSYNLGPRVKRLLARETFDVVHVHEPFMPLLPFQFLRYSPAVNIATFHAAREGGSRLYAYSKFLIRPWWHSMHGRIAHSRAALKLIGKHFAGRYRIIPSGVDVASFAEALPMPRFMDRKRNILFLGRLEKRKGVPFLLEAFAAVKRQMPDTRLLIVGRDGGLREVCERYVESQGLEDVIFLGPVPDDQKVRYFKTADVYCAPNTGAESLGIVLLEAMAAGVPIVASRIEGFADVLCHGREGLLVPPRDSRALAEALCAMLGSDSMREEMGRRASKTVQQYGWPVIAGRVLDYYGHVAAGVDGD